MSTLSACEGFAHPDAPYPAPRGLTVAPKIRYLPAPLIRARASALDPRNCLDLTKQARQALYGICAFLDIKKLSEPVFARRETLCAESLLGSTPTLYRALAVLEAKGYIRREQSRRYGRECYGQYHVSRIWIQEKAAALLGLLWAPGPRPSDCETSNPQDSFAVGERFHEDAPKPPAPPKRPAPAMADFDEPFESFDAPDMTGDEAVDFAVDTLSAGTIDESPAPIQEEAAGTADALYPQPRSINLIDGLLTKELSPTLQLSLREQPPTPARTDRLESKGKSEIKDIDPNTKLPGELLPLMQLGVSKVRICALMGLARKLGHGGRLGALVKLVWHRLKDLRGTAVFAYLSALLKKPKDYARMLEIRDIPEDPNQLPQAVRERVATKLPNLLAKGHGMDLVGRNGKVVGRLTRLSDTSGFVEVVDDKGLRRSMPVNAKLVLAWEEGDVVLRRPYAGEED